MGCLVPTGEDVPRVAAGTAIGVWPLADGEDHSAFLVGGVHVVVAPQPEGVVQ